MEKSKPKVSGLGQLTTRNGREMKVELDNMDVNDRVKSAGLRRKATLNVSFCVKKERNASFKKVSRILQKSESDRTEEEKEVLDSCTEVVKEVTSRLEKRNKLKARSEEVEDSQEVLEAKCDVLARALQQARHLVVYSGAGVSTAACIPDYRGSNGIWTRLQQGLDIGQHDLSNTQPTLTHMVLYALYRRGMLKHVVSQNCDGLHLRSGLPRAALSEVHGNMYLEVCQPCKLEYWRLFDVTEHTGRYSHATARRCYTCHKPLRDTIVHFGERGALKWPINWSGATAAANQADVILCIGSSLKVLKKYPWLWGMDRPVKKRPSLYIVNLQWTPKDDHAALKINGKCDEVMRLVMSKLGMPIPDYSSLQDPIFVHATRLHAVETHTYSTAALDPPDEQRGENNKRASNPKADKESSKRLCVDSSTSDKATIKTEPSDSEKEPAEEKKPVSDSDKTCESSVKSQESEVSKSDSPQALSNREEISDKSKLIDDLKNIEDVKGKEGQVSDKSSLSETNEKVDDECATSNVKEEVVNECATSKVKQEIDNKCQTSINKREVVNVCATSKVKQEVVNECATSKVKQEFVNKCATSKGKEEVDTESTSSQKVNEPKLDDNSKSPVKGIWRPFAFDDNVSSSSSSCVTSSLSIKVESGLQLLPPQQLFRNSEFLSCSNHNSSKPLLQNQSFVKKCHLQIEPLDLSRPNTLEPLKDNPFFCKYCRTNYHSMFCLFYRRQSSDSPPEPPCYCCDEDDEKDPSSPDADAKSADDSDKSTNKVPITNPGWFGKGYRKKIRKKR